MSDVITLSSDEDECPSPKRRKLYESGRWLVSKQLERLLDQKIGNSSSSAEQPNNKRDFNDILKHIHSQGVQVSAIPKNQNRVNSKKLKFKEANEHNFTIVIHDEGPSVNSSTGRSTNKANVDKPKCDTKPVEELITIIINDESPVKKSRSVNNDNIEDANDDILEVKELDALALTTEETDQIICQVEYEEIILDDEKNESTTTTTKITDIVVDDEKEVSSSPVVVNEIVPEAEDKDDKKPPEADVDVICVVEAVEGNVVEIDTNDEHQETSTKITDVVVDDNEEEKKASSSPVVINDIVPETEDNDDKKPSEANIDVICVVEAVEGNVVGIDTNDEQQETSDKGPENADENGTTTSTEQANQICDLIKPKDNNEELLVKTSECPVSNLEDNRDELSVKTSEGPVDSLEDNNDDELLVEIFEGPVDSLEDNNDDELLVKTFEGPVDSLDDNHDELLVETFEGPVDSLEDNNTDELLVKTKECPINNMEDNHDELLAKTIECPVSNPEDNKDEPLLKTTDCPVSNPEDNHDELLVESLEGPIANPEDNQDELPEKTSECPASNPEDNRDEVLEESSECPTGNPEDKRDEVLVKTSENPIADPEDKHDEFLENEPECQIISIPEDNQDELLDNESECQVISIPEDSNDEPQVRALEIPDSNPEDNQDDSPEKSIESPISNDQGKENTDTDSGQLQEEYEAIVVLDPIASTSSHISNNNNNNNNNNEDSEKFTKLLDEFLETVSNSIKDTSYETKVLEKFPKIRSYFDNCKHLSSDSIFLDTIKEATDKAKVSAPNAVVKFSFLYKYLRESMGTETEDIPKEVRSKVRKLEKFMALLSKKIKKLEEAEVDWSDDENSPYIKHDRYVARFNKVHAKYCQLLKKNPHCGRPTHDKITFAHSKYTQINQAITRFCKRNKFPTYRDIETIVKKCTKKYDLPIWSSESSTKSESKMCFEKLGNLLQSRRKRELYDSHCSFITLNEDPATNDAELDRKLKSSAQEREGKLKDIMEKYVRLQEKNVDVALSSEDSEDNSNQEEGSSSDAAEQIEV